MRIAKFNPDKSITDQVKLEEINLTKLPLGSVVALVGKNGAGKSRILRLVEDYFNNISIEDIKQNYLHFIPEFDKLLQNQIIESQNLISNSTRPNSPKIQNSINNLKNLYINYLAKLKIIGISYIKKIEIDSYNELGIKLNSNNINFKLISENKHTENLIKNPSLALQELNNRIANGVLLNEFTIFNSESTLEYLRNLTKEIIIQRQNLLIDHQDNYTHINLEIQKLDEHKLFNKFCSYVKLFLGNDFSYKQINNKEDKITSELLFEKRPFNLSLLSPGQKILFSYAVLFLFLDINSISNIKDSILIIDEPEKHLHPDAQILLINALKKIIANSGQLWIATHSIHILAQLDYDEIFMVKNGVITSPDRTIPGKSFKELMHLDEHVNQLNSFINSISEWAYGNFMVQCFKDPDSVFRTDLEDPQYKLFVEFIKTYNTIQLLDFGAGQGRMGISILEDDTLKSKIKYSAYDADPSCYEILNANSNFNSVFSEPDFQSESFDCVLMCNTLHEIKPELWIEIINKVKSSLKENGYLIIIEDLFLPKGENIRPYGYLILGIQELRLLFNTNHSIDGTPQGEKYKNRIILSAFRKDQLNPTLVSIKKSIKCLTDSAFANIKNLRSELTINEKINDPSHGRLYANQTQLYINSILALEGLNDTAKA